MSEMTNEEQRHRTMIAARCEQEGFGARDPQDWVQDEDEGRISCKLGRFHVLEDDEDVGLYENDEGELTASVVGALEHHNERVHFSFCPDGHDVGTEVSDLSNLESE